ncbi:EF-hand domain-containing protein [Novilysobacter arseniciresistens]|uniref:EF-hand domain-containing protein n=1 Tax=Novilysobacter arseniciresistens TaxID=1385522 RepID=UPI00068E7755|nr:EF-hand domain-containing protein [Lysobacter arseniciresistens]
MNRYTFLTAAIAAVLMMGAAVAAPSPQTDTTAGEANRARHHTGAHDAGDLHHRRHQRRGHGGGMHHVLRLDTDADGRISKVEAGESKRFADRFDGIDRNRDGYLVRSELMAAAERMRTERAAERRAKMQQRFSEADGDGDGKLSRAEVEAAMPRMAKSFAFMDEDRDGFLRPTDMMPARGR